MADSAKKQSLVRELQEARGQIAGNVAGLREDISIGKRFRRSVRENRVAWYGAAALLGLILAKIPSMGKKVVIAKPIFTKEPKAGKAALLLGAIKIALDFGRPAIMNWLKDRALHSRMPSRQQRSRPAVASRFS